MINKQLHKRFSPFLGVLMTATIIFYFAGLNMGLEILGLYVLYPLLFVLTLVLDKGLSIFRVHELLLFFAFLILTFISVFYRNIDLDLFNFAIFKILAAFMGAYFTLTLCVKFNLEDYFHIGFIISLIIIVYFEYILGNFNPVTFYAPRATRGDFSYNANYYSYMSLFANFSVFRLYIKHKSLWTSISVFLIPVIGLAISFTAQTRSGLIFILLINALFWFWVYKPRLNNSFTSLLRKFLLIVFASVFAVQFFNFYANSSIKSRVENTSSEDSRGFLAKEGFKVFLEYPFTGVGTGNFVRYNRNRQVTHNTYLEALSEHGFFIGSLMILVFLLPFFKSYKLFLRDKSNPEYKLNLLFFAIFLFYNNIYVFYNASNGMMYFFLMLGIYYNISAKDPLVNR
jgi:hypothetical protein